MKFGKRQGFSQDFKRCMGVIIAVAQMACAGHRTARSSLELHQIEDLIASNSNTFWDRRASNRNEALVTIPIRIFFQNIGTKTNYVIDSSQIRFEIDSIKPTVDCGKPAGITPGARVELNCDLVFKDQSIATVLNEQKPNLVGKLRIPVDGLRSKALQPNTFEFRFLISKDDF